MISLFTLLTIFTFRKLIGKQVSGSKKGSIDKASTKSKPTTGLIYVKEEYDGWKKACVNILFDKFDSENRTFAPDEEILEALEQSLAICKDGNLNETKRHCMPFIKCKKDQASKLGAAALDQKLPFGEIDVLQENLEFIKRELGLEHVEILSVADPNAVIKAGSHASILDQTAPSPGSPIAIFFS